MTEQSPQSSTMSEPAKFHPALAVNNVKNFIPITLDMENSKYNSWAALFKIHARAYEVLDHLLPPSTTTTAKPSFSSINETDSALWSRLDAIVLQWIYGTISTDLLHTILEPDDTTMDAWNRLTDLFHDNKNSRAVHLKNQFTHTHLDDFPNVSTYCQRLKMLADQLKSVGAPVLNQRLVLQMVVGLNDAYGGVATLIQQSDPLPPFSKARSMLVLEETSMAKRATRESSTALLAAPPQPADETATYHRSIAQQGSSSHSRNNNNRGKKGHNRSRGGNTRGREGRGGGRDIPQQQS